MSNNNERNFKTSFEAGVNFASGARGGGMDDITSRKIIKAIPVFADSANEVIAARDDVAASEDHYESSMDRLTGLAMEVIEPLVLDNFDAMAKKAGEDPDSDWAVMFRTIGDAIEADKGDSRASLRDLARSLSAAIASATVAFLETSKLQREEAGTASIIVQCDDFGPMDQEHVEAVQATVTEATPGALAACNDRLRACTRPARGFRRGDQVQVYAAQDDAEDDGDAS